MKKLFLMLSLLVSGSAFADQCQVLSNYQTIGVRALLEHSIEKSKGFVSLCQNCGETTAVFNPIAANQKIKKVKFSGSREASQFTIEIEGSTQIIDAAYIYVYTNELSTNNNFKWYNVAELVGCSYTGSSRFLTEINNNGRHSRQFHNGTRAE